MFSGGIFFIINLIGFQGFFGGGGGFSEDDGKYQKINKIS